MSYRKITSGLIVVALIALAAITAYFIRADSSKTASLLRPSNIEYVSQGKRIYQESCASCHGVNLEGQVADWQTQGPDGMFPAPPHDETGHTWHHSDQLLFEITKYGVAEASNLKDYESAMPVYEGILTDKEIIAVLSYIKSTWPEEVRIRHDQLNNIE